MSEFAPSLRATLNLALAAALALVTLVSAAEAQQEAVVEQLAPVLAAEDSRSFQPALFRSALVAPDSMVRRLAATAAGRIGDPRATPLLVPLLSDPDSTVRVAAAFAMGLIRDTAGVQPLMDRITGLPPLDGPSAQEAITALAKIGGPRVGAFFGGILGGSVVPSREDRRPLLGQIVVESWRLGADAPVVALLPFLEDTAAGFRWRAAYTLGRVRAPAAPRPTDSSHRSRRPAGRRGGGHGAGADRGGKGAIQRPPGSPGGVGARGQRRVRRGGSQVADEHRLERARGGRRRRSRSRAGREPVVPVGP